MEIGGGFGGKLTAYLEPVAAVLSKKTGRPVTLTMSRSDVMEATGPTSGSYTKVKIGATRDGKITAVESYLAFEAGAYPGSPIGGATANMLTPYDIPNLVLEGYDVVMNKPKTAAYPAPGAPIGCFAVECVLDEPSEKLGMDAMEFRLLNASKEGTRRADGTSNPPIGCVEVMEAVKTHPHYTAPLEGENRGRGVDVGDGARWPRVVAPEADGHAAAPSCWSKARPTSAARVPPCPSNWPRCWAYPWKMCSPRWRTRTPSGSRL